MLKSPVALRDRLSLRVLQAGTLLRHLASPDTWESLLHQDPHIEGRFRLIARERGKKVATREGKNIWTLTGREYLSELMSLASHNPRTTFREDRVAFAGIGSGAQAEVADISSLVDPVAYLAGLYLVPLTAPATFPADGTSTARTSVEFHHIYGYNEISLGSDVVVTEAGLFTDGDPDNDWDLGSVVRSTAAFSRAPVAYKSFEPLTKTTSRTFELLWEVRIV